MASEPFARTTRSSFLHHLPLKAQLHHLHRDHDQVVSYNHASPSRHRLHRQLSESERRKMRKNHPMFDIGVDLDESANSGLTVVA